MRWAARVARAARPTQPPSWRELLSRPEAIPASPGAMPVVAAATTGARTSPVPMLVTTDGPRTSVRKPPSGLMSANQARPAAATAAPGTSVARGPRVAVIRVATRVPATSPAEKGRNAAPVAAAPRPRTCCRYRETK